MEENKKKVDDKASFYYSAGNDFSHVASGSKSREKFHFETNQSPPQNDRRGRTFTNSALK